MTKTTHGDVPVTEKLSNGLFHWGWLLFFVGIPFLGWSALGLLFVFIHWAWVRPKASVQASPVAGEEGMLAPDPTPRLYRLAVYSLLTAYALSIIPAVEKVNAFGEGLGFGLLLMFGLTYAFRIEVQQPNWWQSYVWPVPIAGAASALFGLYQYAFVYGFKGRMMGTHGNPNTYSTALMIGLFLGAAALSRYRDWRRWLIAPYAMLIVAALLTTGSRGAWVGVIAGTAIFLLQIFIRQWRVRPRRALLVGFGGTLAAVLVLWIVYSSVNPGTQARMVSIVDVGANQDRVQLYGTMLHMIKEHPWLGVGMGNIRFRYAEFQQSSRGGVHGLAHNYFLQALGETGVFGTLCLILLWIVWLYFGWPAPDSSTAHLLLYSLLAGLLIRDQFDNALSIFYVAFLLNWLGGTLVASGWTMKRGEIA